MSTSNTRPGKTRPSLLVDMSGVASAGVRAELSELLAGLSDSPRPADRYWSVLGGARVRAAGPRLLVVADLQRCVRGYREAGPHRWLATVRALRPSILALVRGDRDRQLAAWVDDLVQASDGHLVVCDYGRGKQERCLARALAATEREALLSVRYSAREDCLHLEYGDGFYASIPWRALPLRKQMVLPNTARASDDLASIEFLGSDGQIVDVDAAAIRALVDPRARVQLEGENKGVRQAVGRTLRAKRLAAGLTQSVVAERAGFEQSLVSRLESGRHRPRQSTLQRYARALRLSMSELLA